MRQSEGRKAVAVMAKRPITIPLRPAVKGLNVAVPPQSIKEQESPSLFNVRFKAGQIRKRYGFSLKFKGGDSAILRIELLPKVDVLLSSTERKSIVFTREKVLFDDSASLTEVTIYDGDGSTVSTPFTMDPSTDWFSIDIGTGTVHFNPDSDAGSFANGGASFGPDFIAIIGNGVDGVLALAYTEGATTIEAQFLHTNWATGCPTLGVAVAVFDNRLVIGGTNDGFSVIQWSSIGRFDHWDTGTYADTGQQTLGDSADRVQAMKKLGEYLIVYKERSIYIGRKSYLSDPAILFSPAPNQGIGLAAPNSIGVLGDEHIFLGDNDIYIFSLNRFDSIGFRIREEMFNGTDPVLAAQIHNSYGTVVPRYGEYWLFVPTGKWPTDDDYAGSGPEGSVENILANPCFNSDATGWTVSGTGSSSAIQASGGTFGPQMLRVISTTAAAVLTNTVYDYNASIHGKLFSIIAWVKGVLGTVSAKLQIRTYDSAGANESIQSATAQSIVSTDGLTRMSFSVIVNDSDAEQITASLSLDTLSASLDVDCIQLISMDGIDEKYRYTDSDAIVPGFIGPDGNTQLIPFIVDKVGHWMLDTCWVYNYEYDAWSKWRLPLTGFGFGLITDVDIVTIADLIGTIADQDWIYDSVIDAIATPTVMLGQADGQVWQSTEADDVDFYNVLDTAVLCFWESKDFDLDRPDIDKTLSRITLYHKTTHEASSVTVSVSTDSGTSWQDQSVTIRAGYNQTFADFFVTGHQIRFKVQTEDDLGLNGFDMKIIPRGETNAY